MNERRAARANPSLLLSSERAAAQVLLNIVRIHAEIARSSRHQLGKADRPGTGFGTRIETAFLVDERQELVFVDALLTRDPTNQPGDRRIGIRRCDRVILSAWPVH